MVNKTAYYKNTKIYLLKVNKLSAPITKYKSLSIKLKSFKE